MVADTYVAPKTDGTFGLKVKWSELKAPTTSSSGKLPFVPIQPLTAEELSTKTVRQLWNYGTYRKSAPWQQFSPSGMLQNWKAKNFSGQLMTKTGVVSLIVGLTAYGFMFSYPKNAKHLSAEHH